MAISVLRLFIFGAFFLRLPAAAAGALENYIAKADPSYRYHLVKTEERTTHKTHLLRMVSQTWRPGGVSPSEWTHYITVVEPTVISHRQALLIVGGGRTTDGPPDWARNGSYHYMVEVAVGSRAVVAEMRGVPNEPLRFEGDSRERDEDAIIAYSFDRYLETGDESWPVLLPMVKSVVRAMDTVSDFLKHRQVDEYVVAGASKRGWTTWLTAAADRRVKAAVPMVFDMLNIGAQLHHQQTSYGGQSGKLNDYSELKLPERIKNNPRGEHLVAMVDPYSYRKVLTLPKLILLSPGDDYWTVDSAQFYLPELEGKTYLYYAANTDHSLNQSKTVPWTAAAFFYNFISQLPMPGFEAQMNNEDGSYSLHFSSPPKSVFLWTAQSPKRDFRYGTLGPKWQKQELTWQGDNLKGLTTQPTKGYCAYFLEMRYRHPLGFEYGLTTRTSVMGPSSSPAK